MPRVTKEQRARLLEFARRFHELMRQWEAAHPHDRFKVDPKLSRILALVSEYDSGRVRKTRPVRGPAHAPTIFTILALAERLGVPLCALFPADDHVAFSRAQLNLLARLLGGALSIVSPSAARRVQKQAYDFAAGLAGIEGDFAPEPGRVVGYWQATQRRYFLRKENRDSGTIELGAAEEWTVVGTITRFVDAPLRPQERLLRR